MKIIVQKFGGTSIGNNEGKQHALAHIRRAKENGYKIVVVVSAMGRKGEPYATDTLLQLVGKGEFISKREQAMLLSCGETISAVLFTSMLNENGLKAVALTGAKAGFRTNEDYTDGKIIAMECYEVKKLLHAHDVVVVAGFQGATTSGNITTLGRGGSDTSAAALGVSLQAEYIDIFTDVEGIMTADPKIVKNAKPLPRATYNEISNMAYQGAKVIHPRAVEIAMNGKIPLRVRSTYSKTTGTLVTAQTVSENFVTAVTSVPNISQIKVLAKEGMSDLQTDIFQAMARAEISIDFINISPTGVAYTVNSQVVEKATKALKEIGYAPLVTKECAKVSTVGAGMKGVSGITAKMVTALSSKKIKILQSADSHTTIWILVHERDMIEAVNVLHEVFELGTGGRAI